MRDLRPDEKSVLELRIAVACDQAAQVDPVVALSLAGKYGLALDGLVHVVAVPSVLLVDVGNALFPGRVEDAQPGVEDGRVGDRGFDLERKLLTGPGLQLEYVNIPRGSYCPLDQ